jgi:hypothetical protein
VILKRALLIAYPFPPFKGSSGIHRVLSFCRYWPEDGWDVTVLTVQPRAYAEIDTRQLADVPAATQVVRAFALDSARHLSIAGRYLRVTALPDQWISWLPDAVRRGLQLIRKGGIDAIVSTYPIATAHLIGLSLKRLTGLPWVADFRDSMVDPDLPDDPMQRASFLKIERRVIARVDRAVFAAPGAMRMYAERYPDDDSRLRVVENGYDERAFDGINAAKPVAARDRPLTLLHSGALYPSERDPTAFFDALAALKRAGRIEGNRLRVVLRASTSVDLFSSLARERGIEDIVSFPPALPYREALAEMASTDALLVLQASNCNHLIPAKLYECFRARRPIVALTDPAGDTAAKMRAAGVDAIARLDDAAAIAELIERVLREGRDGTLPIASEAAIHAAERRSRAREFAAILDDVAATTAGQRAGGRPHPTVDG